jgi:hypothetical protein
MNICDICNFETECIKCHFCDGNLCSDCIDPFDCKNELIQLCKACSFNPVKCDNCYAIQNVDSALIKCPDCNCRYCIDCVKCDKCEEDKYRRRRLLYLGNLKENEMECNLARIPREIMREIRVFLN